MDSRVAIGPALCKPSSRGGVELGRGQRGQPVTTWTRHRPGDRAPPAGPWHRATRRAWSPATSAPLVSGGARPRRGVGWVSPAFARPSPQPRRRRSGSGSPNSLRTGPSLPLARRGSRAQWTRGAGAGRAPRLAPPSGLLHAPPATGPPAVRRPRPGLLTCPGQLAPDADSAPLGIPCVAVTKRSGAGPRSPAGRRLTFAVTK